MPGGAAPFFDLGEGGLPLALLRGIAVAALFSAFGALLFLASVAPPALARIAAAERATVATRCLRLARVSLGLAVLAELAWLVAESAAMAGAADFAHTIAAVPAVLSDTAFGQFVVAQMALLAAMVLSRVDRGARVRVAALLAGLATVLQGWHLHAAAMYDGFSVLLAAEVLHVLAAGAWLGSLLPLALLIAAVPPDAGAMAARRFSPLGAACVSVLAATGFWQGLVLVGGLHGLIGTAYGWMVLVKLGLVALLIGFAWRNRFRVTPLLSGADAFAARHALQRSVMREAGVGLLIVLAASVLSSLPPAMDTAMPSMPVQPSVIASEGQ